ncbi:glutathione S-transferase [Aquaspirillum serpens]|uniref:glutathione S-transferase n=1 Tax=Aquaspirillum serpens TaxID=190 RepID=UPI0003B4F356|nr:glutathione S-transferase [Aquaspirillum serpens]
MTTTRPLLYSYRRCPYAMRARTSLLIANIEFDIHEIVLKDKPAAMLAASPKGTVPVLCLPDGTVIDQSWDIIQWALQNVPHWWQAAQSADNLALLHTNDGEFKYHLDRYKYPERFSDSQGREVHRQQAMECLLQPLAIRLSANPFLGGEQPCATDIAIFPFVRQFAAIDPVWFAEQPLPALHQWLSYWLTSPLFLRCMAKTPSQQTIKFPL